MLDALTKFRRENPDITRKVAKKYFKILKGELNTASYAEFVKSDTLYSFLDANLSHRNKNYEECDSENKDFRLIDFGAHYDKGDWHHTGTLFERFPAIRKQIDEILKIDSKTKLEFRGLVPIIGRNSATGRTYYASAEWKPFNLKITVLQDRINHGKFFDPSLTGWKILEMLTETRFPSGWENECEYRTPWNKYAGIESILWILKGNERIFPNEEFVKDIHEIADWYDACKCTGFEPSKFVVKKNARKPYTLQDDDRDDSGFDFFVH